MSTNSLYSTSQSFDVSRLDPWVMKAGARREFLVETFKRWANGDWGETAAEVVNSNNALVKSGDNGVVVGIYRVPMELEPFHPRMRVSSVPRMRDPDGWKVRAEWDWNE